MASTILHKLTSVLSMQLWQPLELGYGEPSKISLAMYRAC